MRATGKVVVAQSDLDALKLGSFYTSRQIPHHQTYVVVG